MSYTQFDDKRMAQESNPKDHPEQVEEDDEIQGTDDKDEDDEDEGEDFESEEEGNK